jgi:hypothetical protein
MRVLVAGVLACTAWATLWLPAAAAAELATFAVKEPVGQDWTDEWLTQEVVVQPAGPLKAGSLELTVAGRLLSAFGAACVAVPEATVHEDDTHMARKDNIRPSG